MTNEQSVISAEGEITSLKNTYMSYLQPIVLRINNNEGSSPELNELLKCQQLGNAYFNYVENFVGSSGLLGAHANGLWVTGFAETCHSVLDVYIVHIGFLRSHSSVFASSYQEPDPNAYANMQRMTKEYLPKDTWQPLESRLSKSGLPIEGFKYEGASDLNKTPQWQLITGLIIGVLFLFGIMALVVFIPNPTPSQFFVFRGGFSISLAAIAAIIPGLLTVESRFQKFSIRATGAIAVFIIVWLVNPPVLITS
jgi:hypothetical protein